MVRRRPFHQPAHGVGVGHVEAGGGRPAADSPGRPGGTGPVQIGQHHHCPPVGQRRRQGPPDPRGGPGDDGDRFHAAQPTVMRVIVGSSLGVEIGDRLLLRDASFVVGAGEKVGLVGRNGAGKTSFVSVLVGEPGPQVRSTGNVRVSGTFGYLPQVPAPRGLGLEPNGFSHVLSARGLDVLDDALDQARRQMAKDPTSENIQHFSDLEEQYRRNGGYEAESVMARLAAGLGLPEDALLDDIEQLSGGQRRRVDLIRILFQAPDAMILDEPTNHLDLAAKQWLMEELASFAGSLLVISHDLALLDRAISKVLHLADGRLHEYKGTYSSYRVQLAADQAQRERASTLEGPRDQAALAPWPTPCGVRPSVGPGWPSRSTSGSNGWKGSGPRSSPASARAPSGCPFPAGRPRCRWPCASWPSGTATTPCSRPSTSTPAGGTGSWSSAATGRASRACCAAWPACRSRRRAR